MPALSTQQEPKTQKSQEDSFFKQPPKTRVGRRSNEESGDKIVSLILGILNYPAFTEEKQTIEAQLKALIGDGSDADLVQRKQPELKALLKSLEVPRFNRFTQDFYLQAGECHRNIAKRFLAKENRIIFEEYFAAIEDRFFEIINRIDLSRSEIQIFQYIKKNAIGAAMELIREKSPLGRKTYEVVTAIDALGLEDKTDSAKVTAAINTLRLQEWERRKDGTNFTPYTQPQVAAGIKRRQTRDYRRMETSTHFENMGSSQVHSEDLSVGDESGINNALFTELKRIIDEDLGEVERDLILLSSLENLTPKEMLQIYNSSDRSAPCRCEQATRVLTHKAIETIAAHLSRVA